MPVMLRPRKSIRAQAKRRSSRPHGPGTRAHREEAHDSDSDSGQNWDLETREGARREYLTAAEEADMDLKNCSVLLNRLDVVRNDPSDRDEMSRRSGIPKPASRIPTFHKKTVATEASRAKTPEVKERAIRFTSIETTTGFSTHIATPGFSTHIATPKSDFESYIMVSPRPGIRANWESNQQLPDQTKTGAGAEAGSGDEEEEDEEEKDVEEIEAAAGEMLGKQRGAEERGDEEERGDRDDYDDEGRRGAEPEEEGITEESPPWESHSTETQAKEDVGSWTELDSEEEPQALQPEADNIENIEAQQQPPDADQAEAEAEAETEAETAPCEAEAMPVQTTDTQAKKGTPCCSLLFRGLLPLLLLLFGGLSQHLWHYGLPRSVQQLGAQLELHWLEGVVPQTAPCSSDCRVSLVESIPVGLYPSAPAPRESIAQSWLRLLDRANHSADVAAFYVMLRSLGGEPTDAQGRLVFEKLKSLKSKGVNLRVAVNGPQSSTQDTGELAAAGAEVREIDLTALTGGIIHTKLWALDQTHLYLGSANMDWRSLSQVKEVGVAVEDCSCLSQDVSRVFEVYWAVGGVNGSLPPYWPARLSALSSSQNPLHLKLNGVPARVYLSSAPPHLSTRGRTDDLAAILSVIEDAEQFVHVSVMDYLPQSVFSKPTRFWPPLDSALRAAACSRRLQVRLLVSCWPHSKSAMFVYLQSLLVLNRAPLNCDIQVKVFTVPSTPQQMEIPYARVNHAKFMVTDRVVYIGTSNWSEDYFTQTAGVGLVVNQTGSETGPGLETLRSQADQLFLRDWTSQYVTELSVDQTDACPMART